VKYMVIIYGNKELWDSFSQDEAVAAIGAQDAWNRRIFGTGELLCAYGLADVDAAETIQVRGGVPAVTEGAYAERKEYLASFYVLDCATPEQATELGAEIPFASFNAVELWPIPARGRPGNVRSDRRRTGTSTPPPRSPTPSSCPRRRWPSGSAGPSSASGRRGSPSGSRRTAGARNGCGPSRASCT
jgi:hypothetical protein